jgi:hypothetical protein
MFIFHSSNFKFLFIFFSISAIASCSKDNVENNNPKALINIACKYSLDYSNSDSNLEDTLYIEYYSPTTKENLRDTVINDDYWESPSLTFNSDDSIYFKVVAKTVSYNPMISTTINEKLVPIDDKNIALTYIDYKSKSDNSVLISDGKTIITDTKTLSGIVQFSKK